MEAAFPEAKSALLYCTSHMTDLCSALKVWRTWVGDKLATVKCSQLQNWNKDLSSKWGCGYTVHVRWTIHSLAIHNCCMLRERPSVSWKCSFYDECGSLSPCTTPTCCCWIKCLVLVLKHFQISQWIAAEPCGTQQRGKSTTYRPLLRVVFMPRFVHPYSSPRVAVNQNTKAPL